MKTLEPMQTSQRTSQRTLKSIAEGKDTETSDTNYLNEEVVDYHIYRPNINNFNKTQTEPNSLPPSLPPRSHSILNTYETSDRITYVSIITTHQARLRCLLSKIFNKPMKRFKNGCVLKMEVTNLDITFELVYSGEVDKITPGYVYYVSPNENLIKGTTVFAIDNFRRANDGMYDVQENERFIFYLIRHGEASHNVKKGLPKLFQSISGEKDTSLTSKGVEQARRIYGNIRESERNLTNPDTLYLFSSDLKRTRETMANFISELRKHNTTKYVLPETIEEELIVLPCAHELNYKEDGKCDGRQFLTANENIMNCDSSRPECQTEGGHNVNWDIYTRFYNGTRTKSNSGKQKCRNTDMIKEAIEYIRSADPHVDRRHSRWLAPVLNFDEEYVGADYVRAAAAQEAADREAAAAGADGGLDPDWVFRGDDDESNEDELIDGGRGKRRRLQTKRNKVNKKTKREIIKKNKKTRKQKNKKTRKQRKQRKQRK